MFEMKKFKTVKVSFFGRKTGDQGRTYKIYLNVIVKQFATTDDIRMKIYELSYEHLSKLVIYQ